MVVAVNMVGEKRKLIVIGNSNKPRSFADVKGLPIDYEANNKAWATWGLFLKTTYTNNPETSG